MPARTDPAGHRIDGFAHQGKQARQVFFVQFVEIEDGKRIVACHIFRQPLFLIGGGDGYGRQLFLLHVGFILISGVHKGADTVNFGGILAIADVVKGVDQGNIPHTSLKSGE